MKFYFFAILLTLSSCAQLNPNPNRGYSPELPPKLVAFTTDYCSEWPDGKKENPEQWADCCFTHDLHYWLGGTKEERKQSDLALKECVKFSGSTMAGFLMYIGVRLGGEPGDASYSWGYGWTQSRGYSPLTNEEKNRAMELLRLSPYQQKKNEKKLIHAFVKSLSVAN